MPYLIKFTQICSVKFEIILLVLMSFLNFFLKTSLNLIFLKFSRHIAFGQICHFQGAGYTKCLPRQMKDKIGQLNLTKLQIFRQIYIGQIWRFCRQI